MPPSLAVIRGVHLPPDLNIRGDFGPPLAAFRSRQTPWLSPPRETLGQGPAEQLFLIDRYSKVTQ